MRLDGSSMKAWFRIETNGPALGAGARTRLGSEVLRYSFSTAQEQSRAEQSMNFSNGENINQTSLGSVQNAISLLTRGIYHCSS
jgi:hypothetical protein